MFRRTLIVPVFGRTVSQSRASQKLISLVAECDSLIKAGRGDQVAKRLASESLAKASREIRLPLANICRRVGLVKQGLRLLHPIVRNEKKLDVPANTAEISEYAVLLSRNGSVSEAIDLLTDVLSSPEARRTPDATLFMGFCYISNGDYSLAIPYLEDYLSSSAGDYSKLVARVNLSSAHLEMGEPEKAAALLDQTIEMAERATAHRLAANCFEQKARCYFLNEDFQQARLSLEQAASRLGSGFSFDHLLITKWRVIMKSIEENSTKPLIAFRQLAQEREHWVSIREADLFTIKIAFDQSLYDHLIFGTPLEAYRERVLKQFAAQPSESYRLGDPTADVYFDLETGSLRGRDSLDGNKVHQILTAMSRDFYVPQSVGSLFSAVYPDEHFNVESSPGKVRQILFRTNKWLANADLPCEIRFINGSYRLSIFGSFALRIPLKLASVDPMQARKRTIEKQFPGGTSFTAEEACTQVGWSRSTFHRFSQWAIKNGEIIKRGAGSAIKYEIASKQGSTDLKVGL